MARFNYQRVKAEVHDYLNMAGVNTYDETGIVNDLHDMAYANDWDIDSIDDMNPYIFVYIVEKHDTGTVNLFA